MLIRSLFPALLSLCFCATAWAQSQLDITVQAPGGDSAGAGLMVTVVNADIGLETDVTLDARGNVRLTGLSTAGAYRVVFEGNDRFAPTESTPLVLRDGQRGSLVLTLMPRGIEEIEVTARPLRSYASVNRADAEVSATLFDFELEQLPVQGRDLSRALFRLPNVVQSTGFFAQAPNIAINGANGLFTNYTIDGLDNNENFLGGQKFRMPIGFAQDVSVLASNFSVEFGRTANGVINVTSKSGSNDFTGEVFTVYRPGEPLDGPTAFPARDLGGNFVGSTFSRFQTGFALGGPIIRDRTFFFANLEYTRDDLTNFLTSPLIEGRAEISGENKFVLGSIRLDHRIGDAWRVTLRANQSDVELDNPGGGLEGGATFPSAASTQIRQATLLALQSVYSGRDITYEAALQYSRFDWNFNQPENLGPQTTVQTIGGGETLAVLGNPGGRFDNLERTFQTQHKLTTQIGNHGLKFGVDVIRANFDLTGGGNPAGNYTVELTDAQIDALRDVGIGLTPFDIPLDAAVTGYSVETEPQSFGTSQALYAVYLEDQWTPRPDLTLTLGLRWDYDSLSRGASDSGDFDNIAPRFSANWTPNDISAIRFGAGLFYEKVPYAIVSDALQFSSRSAGFLSQLQALVDQGILPAGTDIDRVTATGPTSVTLTDDLGTAPAYLQGPTGAAAAALAPEGISPQLRILNPNGYDNPFSLQLSLGYQRQLTDDILFYADAIYARGYNLVRLRDLNAPSSFLIDQAALDGLSPAQIAQLPRSVAEADATRPVQPIAGGAQSIIVSETEGRSEFRSLTLNLLKERGDDRYGYRLSYTLSNLRNNTDDINFRAEDANDFRRDFGPSLNDRRHVINAIAYLYPAEGLTLSVAGLFQSGQPINRVPDPALFGTADLNGDGVGFGAQFVGNSDRFPGRARNDDRLPWSSRIDIGLSYAIDLPKRLGGALELSADIFNVFNWNNLSGFFSNATTSNQAQFGGTDSIVQNAAGPPRQIQFGARWKF